MGKNAYEFSRKYNWESAIKQINNYIRKKEGEVKALLMRCTHKGVGLEKIGEQLVCPAHGSIFDFDGKVLQSPAGEALTSFPAVADEKTVLVKIEQ